MFAQRKPDAESPSLATRFTCCAIRSSTAAGRQEEAGRAVVCLFSERSPLRESLSAASNRIVCQWPARQLALLVVMLVMQAANKWRRGRARPVRPAQIDLSGMSWRRPNFRLLLPDWRRVGADSGNNSAGIARAQRRGMRAPSELDRMEAVAQQVRPHLVAARRNELSAAGPFGARSSGRARVGQQWH